MSWVSSRNAALLTDLYELTMAASYFRHGMNGRATFDLFVRKLPDCRNFLVACGLEQAVEYLESFRFDEDSIDYLRGLGFFPDDFLAFLRDLRFTGEVWAVPEGEIVFETEPLLSVTAPLIEAQIVETFLLNAVTFQTMVASKAARMSIACGDRTFVDFSLRRDHGTDAGIKTARAAFVGGASATSNVLAGRLYDIPVSGTMAHSYVMAFGDELEAFRTYARDFPDRTILLIDTFDTEEGARRAVQVARELESQGSRLAGVRIDSGDLADLTRAVRKILDEAGLDEVRILLSGDLDEYRTKELLDDGVPADSFGVGTRLGTSADAPFLETVYKMVEDERGPRVKLSTGKATLPGRKQVYRVHSDDVLDHDLIALRDEEVSSGEPLLVQVMEGGRRRRPPESLSDVRERRRRSQAALPEALLALEAAPRYPVRLGPELEKLLTKMQDGSR